MASEPRRAIDWKGFALLLAIYVAVAFLWRTPVVYPLRLFVVLLHEMSHAIATLLTGGRIIELQITGNEAGHCVTLGGIDFLVVSSGYLGSLVFGATLLLVATRTRASGYVAALLGVLVAMMAYRFMPGWTFGKGFAMFTGFVLAALALVPPVAAEVALRIIGVTSCLYVFLDIKNDVLDRDHPMSDAAALERITGVGAFWWGLLWIGVSVVVTALAAKWAITGGKPPVKAAVKAAAKTPTKTASKASSKSPTKR
ncbi:MAG: M50 family metallopeptidase [Planctomycetes bacterium]|nr:M50 family metallopeptidase [Planctomycetota bacterium]